MKIRTETITLPCYGIELTINYDDDNGGRPESGSIKSELREGSYDENLIEFDAAMDAIESMVLAHAMAEVDVTTNGYIEGLETAISACFDLVD